MKCFSKEYLNFFFFKTMNLEQIFKNKKLKFIKIILKEILFKNYLNKYLQKNIWRRDK